MTVLTRANVSAQLLHYAFFALRLVENRRPRASRGGPTWPAFGVADPDRRTLALTVDDGPHPQWTPPLLDLLAELDITATFFLIGDRVRERPDLARRVAAAGHVIGNHSLTHPWRFAALPARRLAVEIAHTQAVIEDETGVTPALFRAPSGNWSPRVLRCVADHGLAPVDWTVNPSDWRAPGTDHIARILARSRSGQIILCHDGGGDRSQTIAALRAVLPRLRERGMSFGTPVAVRRRPDERNEP